MLRTSNAAYTRLIEEKANLEKKVEAIDSFINKCRKSEIDNITLDEIHLLEEQSYYMRGYLYILKMRISKVNSEVLLYGE